jgi:hypothetical protein
MKEEAERRQIDEEERKNQAEKRRETILRANELIYERNERARQFYREALFAQCREELELQKDLASEKQKRLQREEQERMEETLQRLKNEEALEHLVEQEKTLQRAIHKGELTEQLAEMKRRHISRLRDEKIEALCTKKQLEIAEEKQKIEDLNRKLKSKQLLLDMQMANAQIKSELQMAKQREREEEDKRLLYLKEKEALLDFRKAKSELKFNEKQAVRQKLIDKQIEQLQALQNKDDEKLHREIAEHQVKLDEKEREKEAKTKALKVILVRFSKPN